MNSHIFFQNLKEVDLNIEEFYQKAFKHNIANTNFKSLNYYDFTSGLLGFGKMVNHLNNQLKYDLNLYEEEINYNGDNKKVYYAIDKSGLVHGYFLGPSDFYSALLSDIDENLYFGKGEVYKHVLVKNWKNKSYDVNFETFKKEYLPLGSIPMDENWDGIYRYYYSIAGEMIYKVGNLSFLIPFEEFLKKTLHVNFIENLKISIFQRKFIFTLTSIIHRLKENSCTKYKGEISMENFDIQYEVISED